MVLVELMREYAIWAKDFSLTDDGVAAFLAIHAIEQVRFEMSTRKEGYLERIEEAIKI